MKTNDPCREMFTRKCPIVGCKDLPCARFETDDESRWTDEDRAQWDQQWAERDEKVTQKVWFHRATFADGTVRETKPRPIPESGGKLPCFAGISQNLMQGEYPGVKVEHVEEEVSAI